MTDDKPISQNKQQKMAMVDALTEKLKTAKAVFLANTQGLTHKQFEDLRKNLKTSRTELKVAKNTLLKRALEKVGKNLPAEILSGQTTLVLAYKDETLPLKQLVKFFKTANFGKFKSGFLGEKELSTSEIDQLATLPPHNVLLAKLIGQLQAPIYGLHCALSWNLNKLVWVFHNIKNNKDN